MLKNPRNVFSYRKCYFGVVTLLSMGRRHPNQAMVLLSDTGHIDFMTICTILAPNDFQFNQSETIRMINAPFTCEEPMSFCKICMRIIKIRYRAVVPALLYLCCPRVVRVFLKSGNIINNPGIRASFLTSCPSIFANYLRNPQTSGLLCLIIKIKVFQ